MRDQRQSRVRDAGATRAAILQAAEDFFARDGFAGARVDAIAAASGYNKSLIFQHFGDKLGLYQEVVRRMKERLDERTAAVMAPFQADPDAALDPIQVRRLIETGVRWTFNYYLANSNIVRILAWEAAGGWRTFNAIETEQQQIESRVIRRAQQAGIVRPDLDPVLALMTAAGMALQFHSSLLRYQHVVPARDWISPEALAQAREQIVALAVHGMMVDPLPLPPEPRDTERGAIEATAGAEEASGDKPGTSPEPGNGHQKDARIPPSRRRGRNVEAP
jgi:AcrR family transcriptional regulator